MRPNPASPRPRPARSGGPPRLLLLAVLVLAGGVGVWCWLPARPSLAVALRFLAYTNNGHARIALFEITNPSVEAVTWTLYAEGREPGHRVAVTELVETNGELRHIGSGGPLNLFGHDAMQFGTDELAATEKRVWLGVRPCPPTGGDRQRERLSGWLYRLGWHSGASRVKAGRRVEGPLLP